jgi:hypothetical protein
LYACCTNSSKSHKEESTSIKLPDSPFTISFHKILVEKTDTIFANSALVNGSESLASSIVFIVVIHCSLAR